MESYDKNKDDEKTEHRPKNKSLKNFDTNTSDIIDNTHQRL